ncbi:hypothetical protein GCM10022198_00470 [Klugiella xanthotipulae]|uniref:helix-turn-helix transcriptional regulator n=1 Tax=Klugiella xanthotipulae TaxID=244735 RepID=UPI001FEC7454|nr:helix-turn-helix domain-containing protein [Klugiella xanthotipulae]
MNSPAAIAAYLDVPVATLADWRSRGGGPAFVKMGRLVRYTDAAVVEWVAANTFTRTDHKAG